MSDEQKDETEVQAPWIGRRNFELNAATVLRDVYRLLSVFLADRRVVEEREGDQDPLLKLRERFIEVEIVHTLIGVAILNRGQEEHMRGPRDDPAEISFPPIEMGCGLLKPDIEKSDREVELNFREACNKIIHAVQITVEQEVTADGLTYVPLAVVLRGNRGIKAWEATLDIRNYLRATVANFEL